ncbi:MAG: hypothetical protein AB8F26_07390 [Phycisphaerales bacterium]
MTLTVTADRSELATSERIQITITLNRPLAKPVTLIEPDWQGANWTITDSFDAEPQFIDPNRIVRQRTITLEPFLDGDYVLPAVAIVWGNPELPIRLETTPISVTVNSVLDADDAGILDAPTSTLPPLKTEPFHPLLPIAALLVFLGAALMVWRLTRPPNDRQSTEPDPISDLLRIATSPEIGDTVRVHRLLESLPRHQRNQLKSLIKRCEQSRFDPTSTGDLDHSGIAREALKVLGVNP